jgi:small-conductance mechanosensitive channel
MRRRMLDTFANALACLVLALCLVGTAVAQSPPREVADVAKSELDQIEAMLERRLSSDELTLVRRRLDPVRDQLAAAVSEIEPRLTEARERLSQLGAAPAANAPPEAPEAKQQREEQTKAVAEIDTRVRGLKVQQVRSDQISDRIIERRRQLFTAQLFQRTTSVLDPRFWADLSAAIPRVLRGTRFLVSDWWDHLARNVGAARLAVAGIVSLAAMAGLLMLYRMLRRHGLYAPPSDTPPSRLAMVLSDMRVAAERSLVLPALVGVGVLIAFNFELILPRGQSLIPQAIIGAAVVVAFTRGVLQGALAPSVPAYRLIPLPDDFAEAVYHAMRQIAWLIAAYMLLVAFSQVIIAPVAATVLITSLTALAIAGVGVKFLRSTTEREEPVADGADQPESKSAAGQPWAWVRPALWAAIAVVIGSLFAGYIALAAFVATHVAGAVVISAGTVMVLVLLDALIAEWFGATTVRGRSVAASIGIKPDKLDLIGTLLGGILHVAVIAASVLAVFGATIDDAVFGLRLGEIQAFALTLLVSGCVLAIGFLLLRTVQRWIRDKVLPRTGMDAGLQNSVSTIFNYAGIALVIGLALRQLGLDLSSLAIVAGALSVGIGFGLQSIVSNFVSGLILLAERPIRVGDSIVVKGEEGYVRKISVRSTEIETFERATVILPNADLISGVVKNWTHSNTMGRVAIPVRVAYDSDAELVREELMKAACDNRLVIQDPPPRVFLMRFADLGLDFELRCIVKNVDYSLTVRSELQLAILARFREQGIIIAPPIQPPQNVVK